MNTLVIPDVHGLKFWEKVKDLKDTNVVFLGDYTDPYDNIPQLEVVQNLLNIINFKKNNPDRVTLLLGNHDIHYLDFDFKCSRFNRNYQYVFRDIFTENLDLFKLVHVTDNYIFSHAGINPNWMKQIGISVIDDINLILEKSNMSELQHIPRIRGGMDSFGSCIWEDVRNHKDNFEGYVQIFGHTKLNSIYSINDLNCIDIEDVVEITKHGIEIWSGLQV